MAKVSVKVVMDLVTVDSVHTHCGHVAYLPINRIKNLKRSHRNFYCTVCGTSNYWPDKSDLEKMEIKLNTMKDQRDTVRQSLKYVKRSLVAHKGHTTRLKNRIAAGVCPCCQRTFQNLARHMKCKHPKYTLNENRH